MTSAEFNRLEQKLDYNCQLMNEILSILKEKQERIVTVRDIAQMLGVSEGYLRGDGRRFLPNYGKSDFPGRTLRWKWSTWEAWRKEKGF